MVTLNEEEIEELSKQKPLNLTIGQLKELMAEKAARDPEFALQCQRARDLAASEGPQPEELRDEDWPVQINDPEVD